MSDEKLSLYRCACCNTSIREGEKKIAQIRKDIYGYRHKCSRDFVKSELMGVTATGINVGALTGLLVGSSKDSLWKSLTRTTAIALSAGLIVNAAYRKSLRQKADSIWDLDHMPCLCVDCFLSDLRLDRYGHVYKARFEEGIFDRTEVD